MVVTVQSLSLPGPPQPRRAANRCRAPRCHTARLAAANGRSPHTALRKEAKRRDPAAFYWHPCRGSASGLRAAMTKSRTNRCSCAFRPDRRLRGRSRLAMRIALYRARHPAEHRHDSAAVRLPWSRGPHHRAGRLPDLRPRLPAGRDGLSRPGRDRAACLAGRLRGLARRAGAAAGPVHHARRLPISTMRSGRTMSCCSGANRPACRTQVHPAADARLLIPMREGLRSLNVAVACAMAVGEALRQLRHLSLVTDPRTSVRASATRARYRRRP